MLHQCSHTHAVQGHPAPAAAGSNEASSPTINEPYLRNANPNVPIVGLHVHDDCGDPAKLAYADTEMMQYFDDLQRQVD